MARRSSGGQRDLIPVKGESIDMAASADSSSTESGAARTPVTAERITVALIPKAGKDLQTLQDRTGLSKTDLVNRAITLYEFIDAQQHAERDVLVRDKNGDISTVVIL